MKNKTHERQPLHSRRGFVVSVIRGAIGAGLAFTGGYLLLRGEPEGLCHIDFACDGCGKLRECILPEATAYKVRNFQRPEEKK